MPPAPSELASGCQIARPTGMLWRPRETLLLLLQATGLDRKCATAQAVTMRPHGAGRGEQPGHRSWRREQPDPAAGARAQAGHHGGRAETGAQQRLKAASVKKGPEQAPGAVSIGRGAQAQPELALGGRAETGAQQRLKAASVKKGPAQAPGAVSIGRGAQAQPELTLGGREETGAQKRLKAVSLKKRP